MPVNVGRVNFWLTGPLRLQDGGGDGAKELEELHSERMKVVQLDVCSDEQVDRAVQVIQDSLADSERGKQLGGSVHELRGGSRHACVCVHVPALPSISATPSGLWAVVNNAGVSTFGEVEFASVDTYKQVSEVNLWGTIRVTKAVLPLIRRAKGQQLENKQHTLTH